jgi:hypothetical protein
LTNQLQIQQRQVSSDSDCLLFTGRSHTQG